VLPRVTKCYRSHQQELGDFLSNQSLPPASRITSEGGRIETRPEATDYVLEEALRQPRNTHPASYTNCSADLDRSVRQRPFRSAPRTRARHSDFRRSEIPGNGDEISLPVRSLHSGHSVLIASLMGQTRPAALRRGLNTRIGTTCGNDAADWPTRARKRSHGKAS